MENTRRPKAPGLKWRKRKVGNDVPYWIASPAAIAAGFPTKSARLNALDDDRLIIGRCERLQAEMLLWLDGQRDSGAIFDGTFGSLLKIYQTDVDSTYHKLKPSSRYPYDVYLKKLIPHIGGRSIAAVTGKDLNKWYALWSDGGQKLAAARMALCVIKAAVRFGITLRKPGCAEFRVILDNMTFAAPKPRVFYPTASEIERARAAARQAQRPLRALAYAVQFETTLRQRDVIGEWVDLSDPRPSGVLGYGQKWLGPTWAQIDQHLILRVTPSKTENTSETKVAFGLTECPMVMAELATIPDEKRKGPLIIDERTDLPYRYDVWGAGWRRDRKAADISPQVWNRDLRAGGLTEGDLAGSNPDDRSKIAGHANRRITARVYERNTLEAHRRQATARRVHRGKSDGEDL